MSHSDRIAKDIFSRYGVNVNRAVRGTGWSNATWLTDELVLRVSDREGDDRLRREAQVASLLPGEIGYPSILEFGVTDGYEWSLSKKIEGDSLGKVWSTLTWDQRIKALSQLWQKAELVHLVDIHTVKDAARSRAWYNSNDAVEAETSLLRLMQKGIFSSHQEIELRQMLDRFWEVQSTAPCVLNHGDLTLDNALWYQGEVISLLDFEFAVIAPIELDLNSIVKVAFWPDVGREGHQPSDWVNILQLRQMVLSLSMPVVSHARNIELLYGYAILLELWILEDWLAHPEGEGPLEQWDPYRRLQSLADGHGGYLATLR